MYPTHSPLIHISGCEQIPVNILAHIWFAPLQPNCYISTTEGPLLRFKFRQKPPHMQQTLAIHVDRRCFSRSESARHSVKYRPYKSSTFNLRIYIVLFALGLAHSSASGFSSTLKCQNTARSDESDPPSFISHFPMGICLLSGCFAIGFFFHLACRVTTRYVVESTSVSGLNQSSSTEYPSTAHFLDQKPDAHLRFSRLSSRSGSAPQKTAPGRYFHLTFQQISS
jgi:hypothetical protein